MNSLGKLRDILNGFKLKNPTVGEVEAALDLLDSIEAAASPRPRCTYCGADQNAAKLCSDPLCANDLGEPR